MGATEGTTESRGYTMEAIVTRQGAHALLLEHLRLCSLTRAVGRAGDQALRSTRGRREKRWK